jgi:cysteinyl-tRNA synthetase
MSKSTGNFLTLSEAIAKFSADGKENGYFYYVFYRTMLATEKDFVTQIFLK